MLHVTVWVSSGTKHSCRLKIVTLVNKSLTICISTSSNMPLLVSKQKLINELIKENALCKNYRLIIT